MAKKKTCDDTKKAAVTTGRIRDTGTAAVTLVTNTELATTPGLTGTGSQQRLLLHWCNTHHWLWHLVAATCWTLPAALSLSSQQVIIAYALADLPMTA
jgi:hypothetical protein